MMLSLDRRHGFPSVHRSPFAVYRSPSESSPSPQLASCEVCCSCCFRDKRASGVAIRSGVELREHLSSNRDWLSSLLQFASFGLALSLFCVANLLGCPHCTSSPRHKMMSFLETGARQLHRNARSSQHQRPKRLSNRSFFSSTSRDCLEKKDLGD